jgi:aquaporin NIP
LGVAITFGLVIMAMIYATGHISGAHFNPAVTLAFALSRHFPWQRLLGYCAGQLTGAIAAALLLRASLADVANVGATLPPAPTGKRSSGSSSLPSSSRRDLRPFRPSTVS